MLAHVFDGLLDGVGVCVLDLLALPRIGQCPRDRNGLRGAEQARSAATKEDPDRRVLLSDKTVRNALGPLKACLATARGRV